MAEDTGIRAARPAIHVGGQDVVSLSDGLLSLLVVENAAGLYRCEALFGNWGTSNNATGFLYFDRQVLDFGASFTVKLGPDDSSAIFDGRIMALEAQFPNGRAPQLCVLAEDRLQDLRMTRRTRTFHNVDDADVFRQVANDHNLTPRIDVNGAHHNALAQVNQSDLAFLRERARAIDADVWIEGNTLAVQTHGARARDTVQLSYQRDLREFSALADLSHQRTAVTCSGWDVAAKTAIQRDATEAAIRGELGNDESGVSILQAKIGDRKEALAHTAPITGDQAQLEAEAFFKLSARRFVTARGEAEADSRLRVGNRVDLRELGPLFSGKYTLTEVRHVFDARGIRTEFTAERAGLGRD